jgi:lycopene beta-cyclase
MSGAEYDAIIAGGGLAGLSLAAHLAAGGWRDRSVLLVDDPAPAIPPAACWGSWSAGDGLLRAAATRSYRRVLVHAAGASRVLPLSPYHYRLVRRDDLHRTAMTLLAGCPRFEAIAGRVDAVRDAGEAAEVTVDGRRVRASWAFDSVTPPPLTTVDARLAFTGWEIRCPQPTFEPDTPTLFDFRTRQDGMARFGYVLPADAYSALVESTSFVPRHATAPTPDARAAALAAYLRDVVGCTAYTVRRTESAVLPLCAYPPPRRRGRVLVIGARGGLIKASTGYAYERIQRDSAAITASLARHGHPFDLPHRRRRHRLLDAVLLAVLDRDPGQLELAFARLFAANPAGRVLRFLDEDTGVRDELRLIASMPKRPYLLGVIRALADSHLTRR